MTTIESLEARIDRLEARESLQELVTNYAVACDEHDISKLSNLFTEDAVFKSPSSFMRSDGRDAITTMFIEILKTRGPGYHWTHDLIVKFDDDNKDHATGIVYSHAETTPDGVVSLAAMKYLDKYRRESGSWRFSQREIHFLYYVPADKYTSGLNSKVRLKKGDSWEEADYPEKLEVWQEFERKY